MGARGRGGASARGFDAAQGRRADRRWSRRRVCRVIGDERSSDGCEERRGGERAALQGRRTASGPTATQDRGDESRSDCAEARLSAWPSSLDSSRLYSPTHAAHAQRSLAHSHTLCTVHSRSTRWRPLWRCRRPRRVDRPRPCRPAAAVPLPLPRPDSALPLLPRPRPLPLRLLLQLQLRLSLCRPRICRPRVLVRLLVSSRSLALRRSPPRWTRCCRPSDPITTRTTRTHMQLSPIPLTALGSLMHRRCRRHPSTARHAAASRKRRT